MWRDFKAFLLKQNVLALALAVVIGNATSAVVQGIVSDFIMPLVEPVVDAERWQSTTWEVGPFVFLTGHFASVLVNFLIIAFVAWQITKWFLKEPRKDETPATRPCPFCRQGIDAAATRCAFCTSQIEPLTAAA